MSIVNIVYEEKLSGQGVKSVFFFKNNGLMFCAVYCIIWSFNVGWRERIWHVLPDLLALCTDSPLQGRW